MKKFAYIVLSILAVCLIFTFGCDSPDRDNRDNNENKQITHPLHINGNNKFSREGHLRKDGKILPHIPDHIAPHLKNIPR